MIFVLVVYKVASLNCYFFIPPYLQADGKRVRFFTKKRVSESERSKITSSIMNALD